MFKKIRDAAVPALILAGIMVQSARAAPVPLRDILPFSEFVALIQYNLARVPELEPLWRMKGSEEFYLGGGVLRGFLRWHYLRLQSHTPNELRSAPMPGIAAFQSRGGTDLDLFGPASKAKAAKRALSGNLPELDIIDFSTYLELVKIGGPTIEKIAMGPTSIRDPLDGLRHYYEGRAVFHWAPEPEFQKSRWILENDYSKTGEALRYIRFTHFNLPELAPDPESVRLIRRIASLEREFLNDEARLSWVEICLEKLLIAASGDVPRVLDLLHEYGLLDLLIRAEIQIPDDYLTQFVLPWFKANQQRLSPGEISALQMIQSYCEKKFKQIS